MPESICRIARKCVEKALKGGEEEDLESIHETRKQIKRMRALLRLIRDEIGKKGVQHVLEPLREAAGYLAAPRDAHVKAQALKQLLGEKAKRKSPDRLKAMRAEFQRECAEEAACFRQQKRGKQARSILRKSPNQFRKLNFESDGRSAIATGLEKNYEAARNARDCASAEASPENFHEWRKRVSDLLYNIELLEPIWPEQMCALAAEFDSLGELLGNAHDLHMLRQTAIKKSVDIDLEAEIAELLSLIDPRQKELRAKAVKLGNRILREKPSEFCDRLHSYWNVWKSKHRKNIPKAAPLA